MTAQTNSLSCTLRYIPNPEHWLVENGLMVMIVSESYQNQLSQFHTAGRTVYHWKQALIAEHCRLEALLDPTLTTSENIVSWRERINTAINNIVVSE